MKRLLRSFLSLVGVFAATALFTGAIPESSPAAGNTVLVLPFQVSAGPLLPDASQAVPQAVIDKMKSQGLTPIPLDKARGLFNASGMKSIDLESARRLGRSARADLVVYGSFNQKGQGFTMETRLVPVGTGRAVPTHFERDSVGALGDAAGQLASRASLTLRDAGSSTAPVVGNADAGSEPAPAKPAVNDTLVPLRTGGGVTLSDVTVRGIHNMDPDVVLMRLSIRKGDSPDANAINEEVKRIWEMGYFTDVQAHMEGSVLVFDVVEKPRIDNIIVEGTDKVDEDDVLSAMTTRKGNVLNEQTLSDDLQKITELYRKEGYYLAKPTYRIEKRSGGKGSVLIITVNEGKKLYISEVKVDGLKELKQSDMTKYMALRERGIFSWLTGSGVLKEEYLERDTNAIAAYGLNEGYVDIQVGSPEVTYQEDGIHIHFPVSEGPRYNINEVGFAGDVLDTKENMDKIIEMDDWQKDKKYFHLETMQKDAKALQQYYNDHGYAYAEVDTRVVKPADHPDTVNVVYVINKKQKVFIRRVIVEGNTKTRDNVILREMRLGDGDQYDGAKLRRSMERLNKLRYFKTVDNELVPTDKEDEVDLKVKVKEGNTGALMAGIGYSTYFDVGVSGTIMERNLFGKGYTLSLQGFFSWRRTSGTLSFTNPRVYDTNLSLGNDLYYMHDYWDDFTRDTIGDSIRIGYPIGEYTTVGLGYRLERYEIYDVDENASPYITDYKGINWTSAISAHITRDTTDTHSNPHRGTIARLSGEWGGGGLGGSDNFIKLMADWQGFYSFNDTNTIHLRGRVGALFQNTDENIPVFERFYVGGMDTVRGYSYSDASPRSTDPRYDRDVIGGDYMGVGNFEYVWTFQKDMGLALVPFFDIGFNIDSKTQNVALDFDDHWVYSTGLELRWRSPMGDLRIAYGIPLKEDFDHENESGRLEFSMGQFF